MSKNKNPLFVTLASPLTESVMEEALRLHRSLLSRLSGYVDAGVVTSLDEACRLEGPGAAFIATGGTERLLLEAYEAGFKPYILAAHPGLNSLPALLEARAALRERGFAAATTYLASSPPPMELLSALPRVLGITGARLGVVGEPSPWLVASSVDRGRLREVLGLELVDIDLRELYREYEAAPVPHSLLNMVSERCILSREREELARALRVYVALRRLADRYRLGGLTLRCFDLIEELGTTGCLALAILNSEGFVAGCEGDEQSLVTMYILSRLSGAPAWMANPARVEGDTLLLAHCTAPLAWGGRCRLTTHFESGRGVGVDAVHPGGEVVLARIDKRLERIVAARGVVAESGMRLPGLCRTQIRVRLAADPWVLLDVSPGNHLVMAPGGVWPALRLAASVYGIRLQALSA